MTRRVILSEAKDLRNHMRASTSSLKSKDLLGIEALLPDEIELILDTAEGFKEVSERPVKKVPALRGARICWLE